jgi:hypothetical protein
VLLWYQPAELVLGIITESPPPLFTGHQAPQKTYSTTYNVAPPRPPAQWAQRCLFQQKRLAVDEAGSGQGRVQAARRTADAPSFSVAEDGEGAASAPSTYRATRWAWTLRAGSVKPQTNPTVLETAAPAVWRTWRLSWTETASAPTVSLSGSILFGAGGCTPPKIWRRAKRWGEAGLPAASALDLDTVLAAHPTARVALGSGASARMDFSMAF